MVSAGRIWIVNAPGNSLGIADSPYLLPFPFEGLSTRGTSLCLDGNQLGLIEGVSPPAPDTEELAAHNPVKWG